MAHLCIYAFMITWQYIFINIILDTGCPFVGYKSCPVLRFVVQKTVFFLQTSLFLISIIRFVYLLYLS